MKKKPREKTLSQTPSAEYGGLVGGIAELLEAARRNAARTVNALMTATYWEIGRRIVEFEQQGEERAGYGEKILAKLSHDLTARFGRGFGRRNLFQIRAFYLAYRSIVQTPSAQLVKEQTLSAQSGAGVRATASLESDPVKSQTLFADSQTDKSAGSSRKSRISESVIRISSLSNLAAAFPLPWSHYVRLLSVKGVPAREFYHAESLRGGWSVRQLDRQIASQFYERTGLSRDKAAMLRKAGRSGPGETISADDEVRDPLVLEFLGLKDEYSETDLEEALLRHLENFLLELGGDFAFIGRQRRLRIGGEWYRVDLLFFHRKLRCLVVIDLKVVDFQPEFAGKMNFYQTAVDNVFKADKDAPTIGLILCRGKNKTIVEYTLRDVKSPMGVAEYRLLPAKLKAKLPPVSQIKDAVASLDVQEA